MAVTATVFFKRTAGEAPTGTFHFLKYNMYSYKAQGPMEKKKIKENYKTKSLAPPLGLI
jgi:hypothetical protein